MKFFAFGLTYPVQSVDGHRFKSPPHHWILLQHLVEVVHGERVQAAVGVRPHAGRPSAAGQQADLCGGEIEAGIIKRLQTAGGRQSDGGYRAEVT